jgi:hypothetical protein
MHKMQSKVRNLVVGLGLAIGLANVAQVAQASSCSAWKPCGGYSVYCYCDGTDEADCGLTETGCYYDCGSYGSGTADC